MSRKAATAALLASLALATAGAQLGESQPPAGANVQALAQPKVVKLEMRQMEVTTTTTAPPTTTTTTAPPPTTTTTTTAPAPPPPPPPPANSAGEGSGGVLEAIRSAFAPHGEAAVATAERVAKCESGFNPSARNPSGASGLFQVMPGWSDEYLAVTGVSYATGWSDPWANSRFAAWLAYEASGGGWSHWVCY